jgi:hypothetical protein
MEEDLNISSLVGRGLIQNDKWHPNVPIQMPFVYTMNMTKGVMFIMGYRGDT